MSLRHMILGSLMERPVYGYQLKSGHFKKIFGEFGINHGQLYPLLKKMEREGAIEKIVEFREGAPNRHVYHITPAGREEFLQWLEASDGEEHSYR